LSGGAALAVMNFKHHQKCAPCAVKHKIADFVAFAAVVDGSKKHKAPTRAAGATVQGGDTVSDSLPDVAFAVLTAYFGTPYSARTGKWMANQQGAKFALLTAIILTLAAAVVIAVFDGNPFRPSTYDDCILENMKGVKSDSAAETIKNSCESQFTRNNSRSEQPSNSSYAATNPKGVEILPQDALNKLRIDDKGGVRIPNKQTRDYAIYNGTSEWVVTEILLQAYVYVPNGKSEFREYVINVNVPPLGERITTLDSRWITPSIQRAAGRRMH